MYKVLFFYSCLIYVFTQDNNYWFQGKAEISSYELEQSRYGEIHKGSAVLIFVTEDFSKSKQVKLDYPSKQPEDAIKVLKLNSTRKFLTGIYPYSMMSSVFTPFDQAEYMPSLKLTTSSQEWCGHTFTQFNFQEKTQLYHYEQFSYFESEGDVSSNLKTDLIEDEIWTLIRLNPEKIPTGKLNVLPSGTFLRLSHLKIKAYEANITITEAKMMKKLTINYENLKRKLTIHFNKNFPHEIDSWEEELFSNFTKKTMITKAVKKKRILVDYWNKNKNKDRRLVLELDLPLNH